MAQSYYSWCGTRLHLILEDKLAETYNRAADAFSLAQKAYFEQTGLPWNPNEYLPVVWDDEERLAWNNIGDIINLLVSVNGGKLEINEDQLTSDHLIKLEDLELTGRYFRSLTPDGKTWCQSRDPREVLQATHLSQELTYEKYQHYRSSTGWVPWDPRTD